MNPPLVAMTGLQSADNPSPGVAVARCLKAAGIRTLGIVYSSLETGAYAPNVFDSIVLIDKPEKGITSYFQGIDELIRNWEPDLLIPTLDPEIPLFVDYEVNSGKKLPLLLPNRDALEKVHKYNILDFGKACGFRIPWQEKVHTLKEAKQAARRFGFPLMLKGQWYEAHEIKHIDEMPCFFRQLKERWGLPVVVQQKIIGSEITVVCLCDNQHRLINWGMLRKWGKSSQGKTWCGVSFFNDQYLELVRRFLDLLKWTGPCEIEFFLDEQSGVLTLFEFNMRLPSWIYFGIEAGINFPENMRRIATRQKIPKKGFTSGKIFVRISMDFAVSMERVMTLETKKRIDG